MLVIAVRVYVERISKLAEIEGRNLSKPYVTTAAAPADLQDKRREVITLVWATILLLAVVFAFILVATLSHRLSARIRAEAEQKKEKRKTPYTDPWRESGKRVNVPKDIEES